MGKNKNKLAGQNLGILIKRVPKLTQSYLAGQLGLTQQSISKVIKNEAKPDKLYSIIGILEIDFGIKISANDFYLRHEDFSFLITKLLRMTEGEDKSDESSSQQQRPPNPNKREGSGG